jgi:F-type H+-transporting ATPase subunit delta
MRAASRDSYVAARERLDSLLPASGRGRSKANQVREIVQIAEDLLAVASLLSTEPRLRRALSDPSRSGEDRGGLLRAVLGNRLSEPALELAGAVAAGRWSSSVDLLNATEQLGVEALLASAERAGALGEVEDELFRFNQVVGGNPALAATLGDASAAPERRRELVRSLLDGKADPATVRLAELAVTGFGGRNFAASLSRLVELAAERRELRVAYVKVAAPLSDDEEERLAANLSRIYGQQVSLKVSVEPDLLGGASVQIGHDLYDGTVLHRLNQARSGLLGRTAR